MKFVYEYRTSDNVPHKGVVAAANREAAFAALKQKGIRPGFLGEAPGFFNKLFGKGKRWLAIGALALALGITICYSIVQSPTSNLQPLDDQFDSPVRRQIIGDSAVIEKGIRTGWSNVFALEGDRFLASFAVPGVDPAVKTTTIEELERALKSGEAYPPSEASFAKQSGYRGESFPLQSKSTDLSLESRQILAIVAGMKKDINSLLASGWTLREVGAALVRRQEKEMTFFKLAEQAVAAKKDSGASQAELLAFWEQKNDELRNLGIKLIPMPE